MNCELADYWQKLRFVAAVNIERGMRLGRKNFFILCTFANLYSQNALWRYFIYAIEAIKPRLTLRECYMLREMNTQTNVFSSINSEEKEALECFFHFAFFLLSRS